MLFHISSSVDMDICSWSCGAVSACTNSTTKLLNLQTSVLCHDVMVCIALGSLFASRTLMPLPHRRQSNRPFKHLGLLKSTRNKGTLCPNGVTQSPHGVIAEGLSLLDIAGYCLLLILVELTSFAAEPAFAVLLRPCSPKFEVHLVSMLSQPFRLHPNCERHPRPHTLA